MKRKLSILPILCVLLYACGSDDDIPIRDPDFDPQTSNKMAIEPVTNVQVQEGYGSLVLTWENPSDKNLDHISIKHIGANGQEIKDSIVKDIEELAIVGLSDMQRQEFVLTAYNKKNESSEAVYVKARPMMPPFLQVAQTFLLEARDKKLAISYKNDSQMPVNVTITVPQKDGDALVQELVSIETFTEIEYDNIPEGEFEVSVVIADEFENTIERNEKIEVIKGDIILQVSKALWTVDGFSSEEAVGENNGNNGRCIHMIDDNIWTFWHTQWKDAPGPDNDKWVAFNLGEPIKFYSIELFRRQNDGRGTTKFEVLTKMKKEDEWVSIGIFDRDINTNEGQMYKIEGNPVGQFIKIKTLESNNAHTMFAELNIYTSLER
ncbi:MAG: DUF4959 domain-containing protein [Carboxylicivirga sp.]|jgi:hypothetical protein|nr:DUF4959 domain-containing protein [Carboxylicivirga sp.]